MIIARARSSWRLKAIVTFVALAAALIAMNIGLFFVLPARVESSGELQYLLLPISIGLMIYFAYSFQDVVKFLVQNLPLIIYENGYFIYMSSRKNAITVEKVADIRLSEDGKNAIFSLNDGCERILPVDLAIESPSEIVGQMRAMVGRASGNGETTV